LSHHVCPWWIGYFLASPLRRLWQDPRKILEPFVAPGMTVLEPGPGMGFFTLDLARFAGPQGRIVAVDIQPKMLDVLNSRAHRAGLSDRIETRLVDPGSLGVDDLENQVDFALAFALVHEIPDQESFFAQVHHALRPRGRMLVAEPNGHVTTADFAYSLSAANRCGLRAVGSPPIRSSRTVVLEKEP
jgi:ubiquinone/menaquinone biosynthesis C-methylase UbiE